jgi:hypothetical protein
VDTILNLASDSTSVLLVLCGYKERDYVNACAIVATDVVFIIQLSIGRFLLRVLLAMVPSLLVAVVHAAFRPIIVIASALRTIR